MKFASPLIPGRLIKRYKRFLADVELDTGETITASCPNTGAMLGLAEPGARIWLSTNDSPTRKYRHTWELTDAGPAGASNLVGINTGHPNTIVRDTIEAGRIDELAGYDTLRREVRYGLNSRIDILLEKPGKPPCYVEIKNVHLLRSEGLAEFPDSRTERGVKHLRELSNMVEAGNRAVMLYLVQRADAAHFNVAADIDPAYAAAYRDAAKRGVEMLSYGCTLSPEAIDVTTRLEIVRHEKV